MNLKKYDDLVTPSFNIASTVALLEKDLIKKAYEESLKDEELEHVVSVMSIMLDQTVDLLKQADHMIEDPLFKKIGDDISPRLVRAKIDYMKIVFAATGKITQFLQLCIGNDIYVGGSDNVLSNIALLMTEYDKMEEIFNGWRDKDGRNVDNEGSN